MKRIFCLTFLSFSSLYASHSEQKEPDTSDEVPAYFLTVDPEASSNSQYYQHGQPSSHHGYYKHSKRCRKHHKKYKDGCICD